MKEENSAASKMGAKGGKARAQKMTPEERSEAARAAVQARWEKVREETGKRSGKDTPVAEYNGIVTIGTLEIPCAVLPDGTRVLSETGIVEVLGLYRSGAVHTRERDAADGGAQLPLFVANKNIKPFVDKGLSDVLTNPLWYTTKGSGTKHKGVKAELIPKILDVWLQARDAGVLRGVRQSQVAQTADFLMRALAHVGIIALVDEATGFQYARPRRDLEEYLKKFLAESLVRWARTFPNDYFKHLCRLKGIELRPDMRLPQYFGHLTNDLVYRRIAPGLLKALKERRAERGTASNKLHWWTSQDLGHPSLLLHLGTVVGIMKIHTDYDKFYGQLNTIAPIYPEVPGLFDDPEDWQPADGN
jgi:hypothetical protein